MGPIENKEHTYVMILKDLGISDLKKLAWLNQIDILLPRDTSRNSLGWDVGTVFALI